MWLLHPSLSQKRISTNNPYSQKFFVWQLTSKQEDSRRSTTTELGIVSCANAKRQRNETPTTERERVTVSSTIQIANAMRSSRRRLQSRGPADLVEKEACREGDRLPSVRSGRSRPSPSKADSTRIAIKSCGPRPDHGGVVAGAEARFGHRSQNGAFIRAIAMSIPTAWALRK